MIIRDIERAMNTASKATKYEEAADLRDKIESLNHIHEVAVDIKDTFESSSNILFQRIECFDISNISGKFAVGAMSVAERGKAVPSEYRKFKIKTVKGANEIAMMREMLERRFKHASKTSGWSMPDLIVIDGGVAHLNLVISILNHHKIDIPVVAIAKGEKRDKNEFHYSDSLIANYLKKTPELELTLIIARDEAHRFAIQYYRKLHRKQLLENNTHRSNKNYKVTTRIPTRMEHGYRLNKIKNLNTIVSVLNLCIKSVWLSNLVKLFACLSADR